MRAVLCHAFDGPAALRPGTVEPPAPAADEVLIDVHAAAVSFMDRLLVSGGYQMKPELPFVPGTDAAGVVAAVGAGVTRFSPGDRVVGGGWHGAYAERMAAKEWRCGRLPDSVPFAVAATVPYAYMTAFHALRDRAGLAVGETLFVSGAAGGAGLAALDAGRLFGARLVAGVGDPAKADIVRAYGAADVIALGREDLRARLKTITGGRGVDVAFETLGGETFMTLARAMAPGGRLMPIGFASGEIPALPMNLPLLKAYSVVGVFMGAWTGANPQKAGAMLDEVLGHVGSGALTPHVDRELPLEEAAAVMDLIAARKVRGRIVLRVAGAAGS